MTNHTTAWDAGIPCWVDITVSDLARSQKFYSDIFGWEFSQTGPDFGGYSNAMLDGRTVAGMSPPMEGFDSSVAWVVYLATDDIARTDATATAAGGQQVFPPMEIGPFGHMGLWLDPTGSVFGAWQAKEHTGFQVTDEHGAVAWTDLMTTDFGDAKEFFTSVFGFTYLDMEPDYAMFSVPARPDQPAGGIGKAEEGTPSGWNVCFFVNGVEESLAAIETAGGKALGEATDFEFGRFAPASGPDGEVFVVYHPGEQG